MRFQRGKHDEVHTASTCSNYYRDVVDAISGVLLDPPQVLLT